MEVSMKYNLTLKTPPVMEPLSLTEVKNFLKISDYADTSAGIIVAESILTADRSPGTVTGNTVDVLGYVATIELNVGVVTGALDFKIQESNDNATWDDWYSFPQIISATDQQTITVQYVGDNKYIRVVGITTMANASYSANVILNQGYTSEDEYLSSLITAARQYCEDYQRKAYITQTWEMAFPYFPSVIELPKGNLRTIDLISYKNHLGEVKTLTPDVDYVVSKRGLVGRGVPSYGKTWPSFTPYPLDAVIIEFTCGFGAPSEVPATVLQAMKLLINHWFSNREAVMIGSISKNLEFTLSALLWMDRMVNL